MSKLSKKLLAELQWCSECVGEPDRGMTHSLVLQPKDAKAILEALRPALEGGVWMTVESHNKLIEDVEKLVRRLRGK